jgi:uncharacterized protein YbjQ (UPF0145 family)
MTKKSLIALILFCAAVSAHAARTYYFSFNQLIRGQINTDILDPTIKLYWGDDATPAFAEIARPDIYTRSGYSTTLFGGNKSHCIEGFENALADMITDARKRGYDAIINIRFTVDGKPSDDTSGFSCKPGFKTTEIPLISRFALTSEGARRAAEAEKYALSLPDRAPAKGAVFMPLDPILNSPEAQAILGTTIKAHWGLHNAPTYVDRFGPAEYSDEGDVRKLGVEGACKQAVLNALSAMVEEAKERKYDSIIKIRSFLDERFTPIDTDVECQLDKKTASVTLKASLISPK